MKDKICLVTGGTSGIGKDIVNLLSAKGLNVIFTARNKEKGESVLQDVRLVYPNAKISFVTGDLTVVEDVKKIAEELNGKLDKLDILINNAGAYTHEKRQTKDGYEEQLMVNYLTPRYLCESLLPLLKKSDSGRIVNVTSRMHLKGKTNLDDLNYEKTNYSGFAAYAQTKLLVTAYTQSLASTLTGTPVTAVSMHPGVYSTGITRTLPKPIRFLWNTFISGPIKGAENVVYLALEDKSNGTYFNKTKADKPHPASLDKSFWAKLDSIKI